MTKEEALKHLKELEKKIDEQTVVVKNTARSLETTLTNMTALTKDNIELKEKLVKFEAFDKALGDLIGLQNHGGAGPVSAGATLTNTITELTEHDVKKQAEFSTDSIRGKAVSVIAHGSKGRKWKATEVKEAIEERWGTVDGKSLGIELMRATVDDGILARVDDGHSHFLYFLPSNVVLKEKA